MKGKKKNRFFRVFMGLVYAAMIAAFVCIVLFGSSGCSTGEVTAGANISCLALSVEPKIKFAGINLGAPIITNITCNCTAL